MLFLLDSVFQFCQHSHHLTPPPAYTSHSSSPPQCICVLSQLVHELLSYSSIILSFLNAQFEKVELRVADLSSGPPLSNEKSFDLSFNCTLKLIENSLACNIYYCQIKSECFVVFSHSQHCPPLFNCWKCEWVSVCLPVSSVPSKKNCNRQTSGLSSWLSKYWESLAMINSPVRAVGVLLRKLSIKTLPLHCFK